MAFKKASDFIQETSQEACLIWPLAKENEPEEVLVNLDGRIDSLQKKLKNKVNSSLYVLPISAVEDYLNHFPENSFEILKYIDNNEE